MESVNIGRAMASNESDPGGSKAEVESFPLICAAYVAANGPRLRRHETEKTTSGNSSGREFDPLGKIRMSYNEPWQTAYM